MSLKSLVVFLAITVFCLSDTAYAEGPYRVVGIVQNVEPRGSVEIVRDSSPTRGEREIARYRSLLFPGDRFVFLGAGSVEADVYGKPVTFRAGDVNLTIPDRKIGIFGPEDNSLLARFWPFVSKPRRAIAVYTWSRAPNEPPPPQPMHDSLVPPGTQLVPKDSNHVILLWRNGPGRVLVQSKNSMPVLLESQRQAWVDVPLNVNQSVYALSLQSSGMKWRIERADPPAPDWLKTSAVTTPAQRLIRAIWLMDPARSQWRLFALTELAELAAEGDFTAQQFWEGARSGELQAEIL